MSRHVIGIRPDVSERRLGMLAVVQVTGIDGVTTKTVLVDATDRPDLITAMEVLRVVYRQLSDAGLAAYDDPPRVCECGERTREDECPRCGARP